MKADALTASLASWTLVTPTGPAPTQQRSARPLTPAAAPNSCCLSTPTSGSQPLTAACCRGWFLVTHDCNFQAAQDELNARSADRDRAQTSPQLSAPICVGAPATEFMTNRCSADPLLLGLEVTVAPPSAALGGSVLGRVVDAVFEVGVGVWVGDEVFEGWCVQPVGDLAVGIDL